MFSASLETGAVLGFHGYAFKNEKVAINNETLMLSQVLNSLIIQYAKQTGGVDLGVLYDIITTPHSSLTIINTPKYLRGLGIRVEGGLPKPPSYWARLACEKVVNESRPVNDGYTLSERISQSAPVRTINNNAQLAKILIDDLFPKGNSKRSALSKLSDQDFLDLILEVTPRFPVQKFELRRGAGFYWDGCYTFGTEHDGVYVLFVSKVFGRHFSTNIGKLGYYSDDTPLWHLPNK